MAKIDRVAKTLMNAIRESDKKRTSAYDSQATVTKVEGSTAWVHIPGGVDETPARMTMSAAAGDTVQIRVANGRAWVTGNATAPPTDDRTAIAATGLANQALTSLSLIRLDVDTLVASVAYIETAYITTAHVQELLADYATIATLEANYATINELHSDYTNTATLEANYATISTLQANYATISELHTNYTTTAVLEANYATVNLANVEAGSITSAMIGAGVVGTAQIADSSITSAKIVSLDAAKITTGTLDAALLNVINLNAASITVGTINGYQIAPGAIGFVSLDQEVTDGIDTATTWSLETKYTSTDSVYDFEAHLYHGTEEVTEEYPAVKYKWFVRNEDGDSLLGTGYTITINRSEAGYVGTIVCQWSDELEEYELVTGADDTLVDHDGNTLTVLA